MVKFYNYRCSLREAQWAMRANNDNNENKASWVVCVRWRRVAHTAQPLSFSWWWLLWRTTIVSSPQSTPSPPPPPPPPLIEGVPCRSSLYDETASSDHHLGAAFLRGVWLGWSASHAPQGRSTPDWPLQSSRVRRPRQKVRLWRTSAAVMLCVRVFSKYLWSNATTSIYHNDRGPVQLTSKYRWAPDTVSGAAIVSSRLWFDNSSSTGHWCWCRC